jgi:hypothetical protein
LGGIEAEFPFQKALDYQSGIQLWLHKDLLNAFQNFAILPEVKQ